MLFHALETNPVGEGASNCFDFDEEPTGSLSEEEIHLQDYYDSCSKRNVLTRITFW